MVFTDEGLDIFRYSLPSYVLGNTLGIENWTGQKLNSFLSYLSVVSPVAYAVHLVHQGLNGREKVKVRESGWG